GGGKNARAIFAGRSLHRHNAARLARARRKRRDRIRCEHCCALRSPIMSEPLREPRRRARDADPTAMRAPAPAGTAQPVSGRAAARSDGIVSSDIPARLDRLPWGRFHTLVVVALGVSWVLDGLEVTLAGALSGALKQSPVLHFTNTEVGLASSAYVAGAVLGAVLFGWLTDRIGRRRLFFVTLIIYLTATALTACSWNVWTFAFFRFFTGAGIGGEYAAINSTIQELIPARMRGWTDLVINGRFWLAAPLG